MTIWKLVAATGVVVPVSVTQWAAVRIQVGAITDPPQNCPWNVLPSAELTSAARNGNSPTVVGVPPMMRVSGSNCGSGAGSAVAAGASLEAPRADAVWAVTIASRSASTNTSAVRVVRSVGAAMSIG